jgi:ribosome assembly protein RRB1
MALDYDYQEADDDETLNGVTRTKDNIAIYNPKKYRLAEDEELDYSNEAYTIFHRLNVEWPCLSFDIINDLMGLYRTEFPMTSYIVAGSQASQNFENRLYVLKMSNLLKTQNDSDSEYEDERKMKKKVMSMIVIRRM